MRRAPSLRFLTLTLALALAVGAMAPALSAQTTGTLTGLVTNPKGKPVPGALITIQGPNIQGVRSATTDSKGRFRFNLVPPGPCKVTATAKGYGKEEIASGQIKAETDDISELLNLTIKAATQIALDQMSTMDLVLKPVNELTVEVVAEIQNAVDVKGTSVGQNFTNESFLQLPTSRDYASIATMAPGVTEDTAGLKIYGGTGAENNYVVDGINTTSVEFGKQGKNIPVEFIQEFQVKSGGYEAEYGKATGGIVNVITKSGGNEITGDVFYYYESKGLQGSNKHANEGFKAAPVGFRNADFGFDVGGYFIKDKLWFLVAYDRSQRSTSNKVTTGPSAGSIATNKSTRDLFAGKLTWRINESQSLVASFIGDPEKVDGAVKDAQGPASTYDGTSKTGGTDLSLRYEISGSDWFGQAQVSRHRETNSILPSSAGATQIQVVDNTAAGGGALSGGFGRVDEKDFTRDSITASFSKILGNHELKAGFDYQSDKADISRFWTGGQQVTKYDGGVYSHYYWTIAGSPVTNAPSITFKSTPKHESQAYFVQDKWSVSPKLTLNLGLRLDETDIKDQHGVTKVALKNELSPRFGFVWDWKGKGTDKVYGSFSRFYEQVPLDLVIRSFSDESNPTIFNFDPVSTTPDDAAGTSSIVGSYIEPVDPDIKGQYADEILLGVETTLGTKYVAGAKFIRRYLGRVIEDSLDPNSSSGDYFIMNPGSSQTGKLYPSAVRDYKGLEFSFHRKFSDHYTWQASYLWSKLDGNYEGNFQGIGGADGTGQLDPNINSAFDEPDFIVNSYGPLSGDRTHQVKANGYYEFDSGLSIGASFVWHTGTPITRLGFADQVLPYPYTRYELFLQPRGSEGRTAATARLDVNAGYTYTLANKHKIRLMVDVTNLLDSQTATAVDQRYNFSGLDVGQTNDKFKQGIAFQSPRSIRLGIRYSF